MAEKMMQESVQQFFQIASQDIELQSKLKAAPNREAYISLVVELGKERGYSFTGDQVVTALDTAESKASELSEEQLEAVAGGNGDDSDASSVVSEVFSDVSSDSSASSVGSDVDTEWCNLQPLA